MIEIGDFAIQTGRNFFDYEDPSRSTMTYKDLTRALANICRWGGHCSPFFSVAQHALLVTNIVSRRTDDPYTILMALHHDDHEAVRGDIPTPRKRFLKAHGQLYKGEQDAQDAWIFGELLGLQWPMPEEVQALVKYADNVALATERAYLKPRAEWKSNPTEKPISRAAFSAFIQDATNEDWAEELQATHNLYKRILRNVNRARSERKEREGARSQA